MSQELNSNTTLRDTSARQHAECALILVQQLTVSVSSNTLIFILTVLLKVPEKLFQMTGYYILTRNNHITALCEE